MPRNGSGTYSLPAGNPVTTGTTISSTWANSTLSDLATAMTASISKDGQTTPTANIPMGTFKLTGLGAGSAATDSANLGQVQAHAYDYLSSVSGADTITATASPTLTAYATGQNFRFVSAGANTGAATLDIDSLGAKDITKLGTTALAAGDIPSGAVVEVHYDGTRFQLVNLAAQTTASINSSFINSLTTVTLDPAADYFAIADGSDSGNAKKALVPSATDTASGLVELATSAELNTGTDTGRVSPVSVIRSGFYVRSSSTNTTSGTSVDITGMPSWSNTITLIFNGVSTNGTSAIMVRLGTGGSPASTGYNAFGFGFTGGSVLGVTYTAGFGIQNSAAANDGHYGTLIFTNTGGDIWTLVGNGACGTTATGFMCGGMKSVGGALDIIRITTAGGTDAFDAGSVKIIYS